MNILLSDFVIPHGLLEFSVRAHQCIALSVPVANEPNLVARIGDTYRPAFCDGITLVRVPFSDRRETRWDKWLHQVGSDDIRRSRQIGVGYRASLDCTCWRSNRLGPVHYRRDSENCRSIALTLRQHIVPLDSVAAVSTARHDAIPLVRRNEIWE